MTRPSLLAASCLVALTAGVVGAQVVAAPGAGAAGSVDLPPRRICLQPPVGAEPADAAWDDPCHPEYFNYQRYLAKLGLDAQTPAAWAALGKEARLGKLAEGERFLKARFEELMQKEALTPADREMLQAVWGAAVSAKAQTLAKARELKDPEQIRKALEGVQGLTKKFGGGLSVDWQKVFDGGGRGPVFDDGTDHLKPADARGGFLASLETKEVAAALSTRKAYSEFLLRHGVPPDALPTFQSMYDVLQKAPEAEGRELAHILPTTVRFLADGKSVSLADLDGAYGLARPGDYDRPEAVVLDKAIGKADPLVAAKTLAHEFQHIYDMYAGRYYTLDSEMRGFKVAALYFRSLKAVSPERYAQLRSADDESVRGIVTSAEDYEAALRRSPADFADMVAFGYGYQRRDEGVFHGRVSLREAVDPTFGLPRELAAVRALRARAQAEVAELERAQADVRRRRDAKPSRELDKELEKLTRDLKSARSQFTSLDSQTTVKEIRLRRMQSEVQWLDRRSKGASREPYDLHLPVDAEYLTP